MELQHVLAIMLSQGDQLKKETGSTKVYINKYTFTNQHVQ
jgi:hypothetical protein